MENSTSSLFRDMDYAGRKDDGQTQKETGPFITPPKVRKILGYLDFLMKSVYYVINIFGNL